MKTETIEQFIARGGEIKKHDFREAYAKVVWGHSKYDYINAYKAKKNKLNKEREKHGEKTS